MRVSVVFPPCFLGESKAGRLGSIELLGRQTNDRHEQACRHYDVATVAAITGGYCVTMTEIRRSQ